MAKTFADTLTSPKGGPLRNAEYGQVSDELVNHHNGYCRRDGHWDGTAELSIPKLRRGSYFPPWLLGRRRRAEQVLISEVVADY